MFAWRIACLFHNIKKKIVSKWNLGLFDRSYFIPLRDHRSYLPPGQPMLSRLWETSQEHATRWRTTWKEMCNNKIMTQEKLWKYATTKRWPGKYVTTKWGHGKKYAAIFKHSLIFLCQSLCSSLLSTENVRIFVVLYFFYFSLLVIPSHPSWILTQYNSPRWNETQTREANLEKYFPKRYFSILLNQNEREGWRWSLSLS